MLPQHLSYRAELLSCLLPSTSSICVILWVNNLLSRGMEHDTGMFLSLKSLKSFLSNREFITKTKWSLQAATQDMTLFAFSYPGLFSENTCILYTWLPPPPPPYVCPYDNFCPETARLCAVETCQSLSAVSSYKVVSGTKSFQQDID